MESFIDIHCHVLPGFDDGPDSLEKSLAMLDIARRDGITTIVATPHFREHNNSFRMEELYSALGKLRERAESPVILPGADVAISKNLISDMRKGAVPLINNGTYLLLELPVFSIPPMEQLTGLFSSLHEMNISPLITHPERNAILLDNMSLTGKLVHAGAFLQVTAMSITGEFGRKIRTFTMELFKHDLVKVVATDAHDPIKRPPILSGASKIVKKAFGEDVARRTLIENPSRILNGDDLE